MSPFRRTLMFVGLLVLATSLVLLVLASLPGERGSESQPIPQPELTLPTPEAALPTFRLARLDPPAVIET